MDTPTCAQAQPETFMPPSRVVVTRKHMHSHRHWHTTKQHGARDHIHGDTCSPSSMISLNMPEITERQEDPLHMQLHTHKYAHIHKSCPLHCTHTPHTHTKGKNITHSHLLSPLPAGCQASHKHGALPCTALQCVTQTLENQGFCNSNAFNNKLHKQGTKTLEAVVCPPGTNQGKEQDNNSSWKLELPPHGFVPPPTSQVTVHIHVFIFPFNRS